MNEIGRADQRQHQHPLEKILQQQRQRAWGDFGTELEDRYRVAAAQGVAQAYSMTEQLLKRENLDDVVITWTIYVTPGKAGDVATPVLYKMYYNIPDSDRQEKNWE